MDRSNPLQLNLFTEVLHAYTAEREGRLDNATLYRDVADRAGIPEEAFAERAPVGKDGQLHSLLARQVRWHQQTLKHADILQKVEDERGWWKLTKPAKKDLSEVGRGVALIGFSTELGAAILGHCDHVFAAIDSPITLVITSPPYPLTRARSYGNVPLSMYVDWIVNTIAPVVKNMVAGASICINLSNDKFVPGSPARSTYLERLTLALEDRLGLHLMDRLGMVESRKGSWPSQVREYRPHPTERRLGTCLWMTTDPHRVRSDNRRVLQAHTQRHLDLIAKGGEQREVRYSDGAYSLKVGSFGNPTAGRIPRNVLTFGHNCADQRAYKQAARARGLKAHGVPMPLSLAKFLVELLTEPGEVVADPFGGSFTTAKAAELLGRRWLSTECMAEYVIGSAFRFREQPGFIQHLAA